MWLRQGYFISPTSHRSSAMVHCAGLLWQAIDTARHPPPAATFQTHRRLPRLSHVSCSRTQPRETQPALSEGGTGKRCLRSGRGPWSSGLRTAIETAPHEQRGASCLSANSARFLIVMECRHENAAAKTYHCHRSRVQVGVEDRVGRAAGRLDRQSGQLQLHVLGRRERNDVPRQNSATFWTIKSRSVITVAPGPERGRVGSPASCTTACRTCCVPSIAATSAELKYCMLPAPAAICTATRRAVLTAPVLKVVMLSVSVHSTAFGASFFR